MTEVGVLGATGRSGRAIAVGLVARQVPVVLVGRDPGRLRATAAAVGGSSRTLLAGSLEEAVAALVRRPPAVVVNTVGPFADTGSTVAGACPAGTHYVDLANELGAVRDLLDRHDMAVAGAQTFVTGAGFGVCATESVVLQLCAGRPTPDRVRVDALAAVDVEAGTSGAALAASIVDGVATGGRRYEHGRLVRSRLGADVERLVLPDGSAATTGGGASGELEAAHRASGAPFVVAASGFVPGSPLERAVLPAAAALLARPRIGRPAKRLLAGMRLRAGGRKRDSYAHARVEWTDGALHDGWLRAGEGTAFTAAVAAEVATRLARAEGRPGAYTPGALFGPGLATDVGASFVMPSLGMPPK